MSANINKIQDCSSELSCGKNERSTQTPQSDHRKSANEENRLSGLTSESHNLSYTSGGEDQESFLESNEPQSPPTRPNSTRLIIDTHLTKPQVSASSSTSSTSSKSSALPPITYDQLNRNRYILGSVTFYDSFFGVNELERYFPQHKVRLAILTWNMSSKAPVNYNLAIQEILQLKSSQKLNDTEQESLPELYVIGLQETPNSDVIVDNIKVGIQAVLGPNYVLLKWSAVGVLHASIWIRRELLWSCTSVEMVPIHSRPTAANRIRTKGAIALSFCLFGTSFLFINTHLSAHETNLRTRINQLDKVNQTLNLKRDGFFKSNQSKKPSTPGSSEEKNKSSLQDGNQEESIHTENVARTQSSAESNSKRKTRTNSEYIFWFGDLNFRLELPVETVSETIKQIINSENEEERLIHQHQLMRSDQLTNLMARGMIFNGFDEAIWPPPFLPTYKCKINNTKTISLTNSGVSHKYKSDYSSPESISSSPTQSTMSSASSINTNSSAATTNDGQNPKTKQSNTAEEDSLVNEDIYDYGRVPSYTDRILYQSKFSGDKKELANQSIKCMYYNAISSVSSSDHKPVYALFEVHLESGGPRLPLRARRIQQLTEEVTGCKTLQREPSLNSSNTNINRLLNGHRNISFFGRKRIRINNKLKESRNLQTSSTSKLDKLAHLNAGAFERQVFIDGLRLRNNLIQSCSMDEIKQKPNQVGLFKSRSFDSNVVGQSTTQLTPFGEQTTFENYSESMLNQPLLDKSEPRNEVNSENIVNSSKTSSVCMLM